MAELRRLFLSHRCLAGLLIACALMMKLLVPAGYMVSSDHLQITVALCSGTGAETMTMSIPMKPGHQDRHGAKAEMPCAFAGLAMQALSAADPPLLAAMILFVMRVAVRTPSPAPRRSTARLRPPLRGPPSIA